MGKDKDGFGILGKLVVLGLIGVTAKAVNEGLEFRQRA